MSLHPWAHCVGLKPTAAGLDKQMLRVRLSSNESEAEAPKVPGSPQAQ